MTEDNTVLQDEDIILADDTVDEPTTKVASNDEETPEQGIAELKAKLEREQIARAEAEQRARQHELASHRAQHEVQDGNLMIIKSAITTVKQNTDSLKAAYSASMAAGDFDRAANIQEAMAANSAKLLQLENGRSALEQQLANPVQPMPRQMDPVEQVASQLSPRSAAWVRNHPECVNDQKLYAKMVGAHNFAVADGYVPDSDAYFDFIERSLGYRSAPQQNESVEAAENPQSTAASVRQQRTSAPAAPTSRTASSNNGRPNVVKLTASEREMAEMMKMTPEEYAKNKVLAQKEGRFNR
jgi:hypothetical protein